MSFTPRSSLDGRAQLFAHRDKGAAVHLSGHEEMRNRRPALRRSFGHQPADRAQGFARCGSTDAFALRGNRSRRRAF